MLRSSPIEIKESNGLIVKQLNLLKFEYDIELMKQCFVGKELIIVNSKQPIYGLIQLARTDCKVLEQLNTIDYLCVGQSTAQLIKQSFNVHPKIVADTQSQLIHAITNLNLNNALYLVGNLSDQIQLPGCQVIQSYSNTPIDSHQYQLQLQNQQIDLNLVKYVVYFSGSNIHHWLKLQKVDLQKYKYIALGSKAEHALRSIKSDLQIYVCDTPNIESVWKLLDKLERINYD